MGTLSLALWITAMAGTAVASPPPVTVSGSVSYSANTTDVGGGCFHATSYGWVDARIRVGEVSLPLRGALSIDRLDNGFSLCGPSSFQLTSFFGALMGPLSSDTVDCHGADPNPTTSCTLSLGLTITDGTGVFKLFHLVNGQLQIEVDFKLVSGQFPAAFGTSGTGTVNGSLIG
jgi:hypothetical protein